MILVVFTEYYFLMKYSCINDVDVWLLVNPSDNKTQHSKRTKNINIVWNECSLSVSLSSFITLFIQRNAVYLCHRSQWIHLFLLFLCYWMTLPKISTFSHKMDPSWWQLNTFYTDYAQRSFRSDLIFEKSLIMKQVTSICHYYWRLKRKRISLFRFNLVISIIRKCSIWPKNLFRNNFYPQAMNLIHETYKC